MDEKSIYTEYNSMDVYKYISMCVEDFRIYENFYF
jgi:hypothetical protein